ncbi:hypothetical protein [Uliginosibacterium gangwonense]|uniref:hypothetical protein n=1 Tax=Uliginosibacterium gangwonense TaxID=392736 RepID=UPI0012F84CBA|nr:hypothetical protein [Uliginosibacterium gangwonense]
MRKAILALVCLRLMVACGGGDGESSGASGSGETYAELSVSRIDAIAAMLPDQPAGSGPTCADRASWGKPELASRVTDILANADTRLTQAFPAWSDADYLDYSQTGSRTRGEAMMNARKSWIYPLVMAECVRYDGRYLAAIEKTLTELASQPTWTWPEQDKTLRNFRYANYEVDLMAADTAHELAQTLYLLGNKISTPVRQSVLTALEQRIFTPLRRTLQTGNSDNWWLANHYSWNAVCLKGTVGAALAALPDHRDRAVFVAMGEHYIQNYLGTFGNDGYNVEGPSYWNYGYGHFTELRELIGRASENKIDLFSDPKVRNIALYGARIQMFPNNVAAFSDTSPTTKMDSFVLGYNNDAQGLGLSSSLATAALSSSTKQSANSAPLAVASTILFATPYALTGSSVVIDPLRGYFSDVGVLVTRPASGSSNKIAASIKSGGNGAHSHNDIGSYTIALNAEQPSGDVGKPAYTSKTFSSERYTIKAINSYGHPVPVVDGQLQIDATSVKHKVLATHFTDADDEITIDLKPAYSLSGLQTLTRTLHHKRADGGSISIQDDFSYDVPRSFETAMTTTGSWQLIAPDTIELWKTNEHLIAKIEASAAYSVSGEVIDEEGLIFKRIAIRLNGNQQTGWVKVVMQSK